MATTSLSKSSQINTTGGTFASGTQAQTFKDSDYGPQALSTTKQLRRFFEQLNPLVAAIQGNTDTGVNIGALDGDIISFTVPAIISDWQPLTLGAGAPSVPGNTILCQTGATSTNAVRKDGWGNVWLEANVNGAVTLYTLPQEYWPPCTVNSSVISVSPAGVVTSTGAGVLMMSWPAVTLSAGQVPGFPVYLKAAQGRTPAGVFLMGVKPSKVQDIYKATSGLYTGALAVSWTWLSGTAPSLTDNSHVNTIRLDNIFGLSTQQEMTATVLILYSLTGQSGGA